MANAVGELIADGDSAELLDLKLSLYPPNDVGNSMRFMERYGDDLMFVRDVGWHKYASGYWQNIGAVENVKILAAGIGFGILEEVSALQSKNGFEFYLDKFPHREKSDLNELATMLYKWANKSGNGGPITSMIKIAEPNLTIDPSEVDKHKYLLNLKNGTMVLDRTCLEFLPHDREHKITKQLNVEYNAGAKCPKFDKFIEQTLPDDEVREFVQTYLGYCLTGDISEQKFIFFYGGGSNGKSVLIDIISRIIGKYSISLNFDSFSDGDRKKGGDATPDLARLPGTRLVRVSEIAEGDRLNEATVKQVTGGEEMSVRHLQKGFFSFYPEFKMILSGNHKPMIRGGDHGIWRRICLVNFANIVADEDQDLHLADKLWAEREGILLWILDGCQKWFVGKRLKIPQAVLDETAEYRADSDPMMVFIGDELIYDPGAKTSLNDICERFKVWTEETGLTKDWQRRTISKALKERLIYHEHGEVALKELSIRANGNVAYFKDISLTPREGE